jgi:hypothetical protein
MTAHLKPSVIEALRTLWVALPLKAAGDDGSDPRERQMAILDTYCFALREFSPQAVGSVVDALRDGRIKDASKRFCPTAPELATYVREEQSRLDAINRPRMVSYKPPASDLRPFEIGMNKRRISAEDRRLVKIADCPTNDRWRAGHKANEWPVGAIWIPPLGEVWGPQA